MEKDAFIFSGRKGMTETPREFRKYPRQPQSSTNASKSIHNIEMDALGVVVENGSRFDQDAVFFVCT